jgi:pyruvate kinase
VRRTKIVATIGPASEGLEILVRLIEAGVDVARLNFSHGTQDEHETRIKSIRRAAATVGKPVAIMIDLKGPEIRVGTFEAGKVDLAEGDVFTLTTEQCVGNQERVWVQYPDIVGDVPVGGYLLLDDGNITLQATELTATSIRTKVIVGGTLSDRKKVNLPGVKVSLPALSEKDMNDIRFGVRMGVDFVAGSFIRKAQDVLDIRRVIEEVGGNQHIIAKVESQEGFDNLENILQVANGLMVARGDLGVEVATEEVPMMQKRMIERANQLGKPVITATQMLESMVTKPRPTRAEASDVANAIIDGTDAIMLSAESAAGHYPVEAVKTMANIAARVEAELDYEGILNRKRRTGQLGTVTDAISHATVTSAADLGARAIISGTRSGFTARMVSKYRPASPIVAVTPDEAVARKLNLVWGVTTVVKPETPDTDAMMDRAVEGALETGIVQNGDLVVITAGVPAGVQGTTNLIKVHTVADVLVRGTGIGRTPVSGRARVVITADDIEKVQAGDIIITTLTESNYVPAMELCAGIVTEEGGLTSHAAVAGISLGKPVIVGAERATLRIKDGMTITLDVTRGQILRGEVTVR